MDGETRVGLLLGTLVVASGALGGVVGNTAGAIDQKNTDIDKIEGLGKVDVVSTNGTSTVFTTIEGKFDVVKDSDGNILGAKFTPQDINALKGIVRASDIVVPQTPNAVQTQVKL